MWHVGSIPSCRPLGWLTVRLQFLKKTMGVTEDDPQKELKDELKHLFSKLCGKLDALCNFHYTPKAAIPEMKVGHESDLPSSTAT